MSEEKKQTYYEYDPVRNVILKCEYRKIKGEYKLRKAKQENKAEMPGNYGEQVKRQAEEIKDLDNQLNKRMEMLEAADNTYRELMESLQSKNEEIEKLAAALKAEDVQNEQITKLENDNITLEEQITNLQNDNITLEEQNEQLNNEMKIKIDEHSKQYEKYHSKLWRLKEEIKQHKAELEGRENQILALNIENTNTANNAAQLKEINEKLKQSIIQIMKISFENL